MPRDEQRHQGRTRRRRSLLVALFSLMPMLVIAGMLAPGLVKVSATEEEPAEGYSTRINRRLSRYAHQPLLIPRDYSVGFIPELLDLERLFSPAASGDDTGSHERARLPLFAQSDGEAIVLDDVDQRIREIVFDDPVLMAKKDAGPWPPPAADITPLGGGHGTAGGGPRFDDYLGPNVDVDDATVVPEPTSGLLVGLGLTLLGVTRRVRGPRCFRPARP